MTQDADRADEGDVWVFGYGSLMWRPDFNFAEQALGRLRGWRRSLCIYSVLYRGTRERPGLVFGLDRGGSCRGMAFRLAPSERDAALATIRAREMIMGAYVEREIGVELADGRKFRALTYVANRASAHYAGGLDRSARFDMVAQSVGELGTNRDYLLNTRAFLARFGIADGELDWMSERL